MFLNLRSEYPLLFKAFLDILFEYHFLYDLKTFVQFHLMSRYDKSVWEL